MGGKAVFSLKKVGGGDIIAVGKENFIRKKVGRVLRIQNNITGCFKFIQYLSTRPTFMVSALENRDYRGAWVEAFISTPHLASCIFVNLGLSSN